ncbi:MAG: D-threonate 4-phosphate dehydrogenase [Elusimicrobia bacterium]|nr:D-threonate 4-phosphate dehydrogenase [Elusimicrobiota bacterium]
MKPIIGLTLGDPSGIGPEIVLKVLHLSKFKNRCGFRIYGDQAVLSWVNKHVFKRAHLPRAAFESFNSLTVPIRFGTVQAACGYASGRYVEAAIRDALNHKIDAMVTGPINKESFRMGGWGKRYTGHTEMLAGLTKTEKVALMLVYGSLRAIHVTSHIPLRNVPSNLNQQRVLDTILLAHQGLKQLGKSTPRVAVCGLNPHAGENGLLGTEEQQIIFPAIRKANRKRIHVQGPLSADTVWPMVRDGIYDVGVAMYHDQGQIPIKLLSFSTGRKATNVEGVNVTVGLPIIRTSVAHGTAFEIAGKGIASEKSLIQAIELALVMVQHRARKNR